MIMNDE